MSVVLIYGRPGGGKTYSAVEQFILPALKAGRRVVHNIHGLKEEGTVSFPLAPIFPITQISDGGEIKFLLPNDFYRGADIIRKMGSPPVLMKTAAFYPRGYVLLPAPDGLGNPADPNNDYRLQDVDPRFAALIPDGRAGGVLPDSQPLPDFFIRAGDLVVIDEVFLVFSRTNPVQMRGGVAMRFTNEWALRFIEFLRTHRHYAGGKGRVSCDVLLLSQTDTDIPENIALLAEKTIICKTSVARGGKSLIRNSYDGLQRMKTAKLQHAVESQNFRPRSAVFSLYQSYTADGAIKESLRGFGLFRLYRTLIFSGLGFLAAVCGFGFWVHSVYNSAPQAPEGGVVSAPVGATGIPVAVLPPRCSLAFAADGAPVVCLEWFYGL